MNQEKKFLGTVITGCLVSLVLNFVLIPHFKEQGAAMANISTELLISLLSGWYAFKLISFSVNIKVIGQYIGASLLFIPVVFICRQFSVSAVGILFIAIPACFLTYFICQYYIFKNIAVIEMRTYLLKLIKR